MLELPDFSALTISQDSAAASSKQYDALDHTLIVLPKHPADDLFRSLPLSEQLRKTFARTSSDGAGSIQSRLNNARATALTVATVEHSSPFATLSWARKLIAECLKGQPGKLGVLVVGLNDEARQRTLEAIVAAAEAAAFELPSFKTGKKPRKRRLRSLRILAAKPRASLAEIRAEALGNNIARWFTALPPNQLTAASYRQAVQTLAERYSLRYEFVGEAKLEKLKAGAFLAVSQGNAERDAGMLRLRYRPKKQREPDLTLVGKGILFDTGGTNLKPFKGMLDMHIDMQGSAVALGCIIALAKLKVPFAIDAWLAVTENRLSSTAYKSQDIVFASNGTSIQVIHTDAEGRMVLADALALAARDKPKLIIDYATLTGSCIAALTDRYSGVFSNRDGANALLLKAGMDCGERVWPFPMDDDFDESLRSETADIKQCAADGRGDHILAAKFLKRFVPESIPWVHVDLGGGQHKGGLAHIPTEITGFGVRLTVELLRRQATSPAELVSKFSQ